MSYYHSDDDGTDIDDRDGELSADTYEEIETLVCLDGHKSECRGPVEYRMALSGTGQSFARCDHHWELRLEEQERINERYPDSPLAPAWFDPSYAGEQWDED